MFMRVEFSSCDVLVIAQEGAGSLSEESGYGA